MLVDNRAAARDATEHLLELGHRRIAFVEGPAGLHTSAHRREGFATAIAGAGADAVVLPGGFEFEAGVGRRGDAAGATALPDAVLGVNDEVAIGLLDRPAARRRRRARARSRSPGSTTRARRASST